jgi:fibronectin-binding autotransporter adhesin
MNKISCVTWKIRAALGASLAMGIAPSAAAQNLPFGGPGDATGDTTALDPSIPYIADGISGPRDLDIGAHDLHLTAANGTYSGTISGAGGLFVLGGEQTLTGRNTYAGGTTVRNGATVAIDHDAALGTGALTLDGGNLTALQSMTSDRQITFGAKGASITTLDGVTLHEQGDLTGDGGLVKLGGGTLVVSGRNTFTGGTLIEGGVIHIDEGSSLGSGAVVLKGGMLETDFALITDQPILSSGDSGVAVGDGASVEFGGDLVAGGGDACFAKSGEGSLRLSGRARLGSGTCVTQGDLSVDGHLESTLVQVNRGAALHGVGVITAPVHVDGRLGGGDAPGTLTIVGDVTLRSTATLQVDIDGVGKANGANNYSRVLVEGSGHQFIAGGTLAPTLRALAGDATNTYTPTLGTTYRIVEAEGGIVGRFTSITQPTEGLAANTRFLAFYGLDGGHAIDLRVAPVSYATLLGKAARRNDRAVASALDTLISKQDAGTATDTQSDVLYIASSLRANQIGTMVNQLTGEMHAAEAAAARDAGLGMRRDVADHLATDGDSREAAHRVWMNLGRDGSHTGADHQANGHDTHTNRSIVGFDLYAGHSTVLGVAASHNITSTNAHIGSGRIRGSSGIVYAQQVLGGFVLDAMAARGTTRWSTRRADPFGRAQLTSRSSGLDTLASATLRMPTQTNGGHRVEPYVSATWQKVERDAATERGGSVATLSLGRLSASGTRVAAGVTLGSRADDPLASTFTWRASMALGADTAGLLNPRVRNKVAGLPFDTAAPGVGRGFAQLDANGTVRLSKQAYLYGGINTEARSHRSALGATAGVRLAF